MKRIERSQIPFKIKPETKLLLEFKKDVKYTRNYLEGPYHETQNIVEIIDENNIEENNKTKYIRYNDNVRNNYVDSIVINKNTKNDDNNKNDGIQILKLKKEPKDIISKEKDFIRLTRLNPVSHAQMTIDEEKAEDEIKKFNNITSIYTLIKREHTYLRSTYDLYISKNHPSFLATILAEILDKIYLIKTFIFLKKFDIFSVHLSLYMFYHILLLSLICGFFTVNTIKKIWEESDYPRMNFYLLYGFLSNVIIWVIYKIFLLLLDNQDRIRALIKYSNDNNMYGNNELGENEKEKKNDINSEISDNDEQIKQNVLERYEELIKKIKIQIIAYFITILIITGFCFLYLVSFFGIYIGTKRFVLKAYYISIIEIILIKFVCGLCLGYLRIAAERNKSSRIYSFVYICDKYLS